MDEVDRTDPFPRTVRENAAAVLEFLKSEDADIGVAESLTGGLLCGALTAIPGASSCVRGGVCAYQTPVKHELLLVDAALLEEYGAVSAQCAEAMALGARELFKTKCALSTTGVAGPDRDERGVAVGTVYVGCSYGDQTRVFSYHFDQRLSREEIRRATIDNALRDSLAFLKSFVRPHR